MFVVRARSIIFHCLANRRTVRFARTCMRYAAMAPEAFKAGGWVGGLCLIVFAPYLAFIESNRKPVRALSLEKDFHYALS